MTTTVNCPQCGTEESLEFELSRDYQGDGAWGQTVEIVELVGQECQCQLTSENESSAYATAESAFADHDPANDIDFDFEVSGFGGGYDIDY